MRLDGVANTDTIDVAAAIKFIVATHWHDDHMQGISGIFQAATSARFICTQAVGQPDFSEILSAWTGTRFLPGGSGVDEMHRVLSEIRKRSKTAGFPAPKLASAGKELWTKTTPAPITIKALSPSDTAVLSAIARLEGVLPASRKVRTRIPSLAPNDSSVAISVAAGNHRLLLGADLEVHGERGMGWTAVVDEWGERDAKHQVFKVPHHGSPTAHCDEVWDRMLINQPLSAVTPFVRGKVRLPSLSDCQRILTRTRRAYLTAPPAPGKFRDPNRTVEKTVNEATLSAQLVPGRYGQVRIRKGLLESASTDWSVELFGDALDLGSYTQTPG